MKLYYDNLFSYMPNAELVDDKPVINIKLDSARKAMIMLAQFQTTQNVAALYEAVNQICTYADISISELIFSLGHIDVATDTVENLLDIEAKKLFTWATTYDSKAETNPEFDYKYFAATLLSIAHTAYALAERGRSSDKISNDIQEGNKDAQM